MTRFAGIIFAQCAVYMISRPVEAPLEVLKTKEEGGWKLVDFKGPCNTDVPDMVQEHVKKWFNERKDKPRSVEVPKSIGGFTQAEFYAYIAREGLPVPVQYDYNPYVDDVLNEYELERNTEFAKGSLPEYIETDFSFKPVRWAKEVTEVLYVNPYLPKKYLKSARDGKSFVYIFGISEKRLVFLSTQILPEKKIEIECVYPHSDRILTRLREWIDTYVIINGFPLAFKDENQMELELS